MLSESVGFIETSCYICKQPHDEDLIILCDGESCTKEMHLYCQIPPYFEVPKDNWYCMSCSNEGNSDLLARYLFSLSLVRKKINSIHYNSLRASIISTLIKQILNSIKKFTIPFRSFPLGSESIEIDSKDVIDNYLKYSEILNPELDEVIQYNKSNLSKESSQFYKVPPKYSLVGCLIKVFNPLDNIYHTGRIISDRYNSNFKIIENLVVFNSGLENRNKRIIEWIILEEHICIINHYKSTVMINYSNKLLELNQFYRSGLFYILDPFLSCLIPFLKKPPKGGKDVNSNDNYFKNLFFNKFNFMEFYYEKYSKSSFTVKDVLELFINNTEQESEKNENNIEKKNDSVLLKDSLLIFSPKFDKFFLIYNRDYQILLHNNIVKEFSYNHLYKKLDKINFVNQLNELELILSIFRYQNFLSYVSHFNPNYSNLNQIINDNYLNVLSSSPNDSSSPFFISSPDMLSSLTFPNDSLSIKLLEKISENLSECNSKNLKSKHCLTYITSEISNSMTNSSYSIYKNYLVEKQNELYPNKKKFSTTYNDSQIILLDSTYLLTLGWIPNTKLLLPAYYHENNFEVEDDDDDDDEEEIEKLEVNEISSNEIIEDSEDNFKFNYDIEITPLSLDLWIEKSKSYILDNEEKNKNSISLKKKKERKILKDKKDERNRLRREEYQKKKLLSQNIEKEKIDLNYEKKNQLLQKKLYSNIYFRTTRAMHARSEGLLTIVENYEKNNLLDNIESEEYLPITKIKKNSQFYEDPEIIDEVEFLQSKKKIKLLDQQKNEEFLDSSNDDFNNEVDTSIPTNDINQSSKDKINPILETENKTDSIPFSNNSSINKKSLPTHVSSGHRIEPIKSSHYNRPHRPLNILSSNTEQRKVKLLESSEVKSDITTSIFPQREKTTKKTIHLINFDSKPIKK